MSDKQQVREHSFLVSDLMVSGFAGKIDVDGHAGITQLDAGSLKADATPDAKAQRFELITAAKSGKHIELSLLAQTFEQTKDSNRRYLRLGDDKLESRAGTWKGQPYLTDHVTWSSKASMGSITSSKAVPTDRGMAFEQRLHAVKSEAVIGLLDGTFNKFSIGWWPSGPILCSVHSCDVMKADACNCWPGDKVTLADGRMKTAEWIFTDFKGKETSTVVIPAVQNTFVGDVRAALAAELDIGHRLTRTLHSVSNPHQDPKENSMHFARLAAALKLAALTETDEPAALTAVSTMQQQVATAETALAAANVKLAQAEVAIRALTASSQRTQVDSILESEGYIAGKLKRGRDENGKPTASARETRLRRIAAEPDGIAALKAELEEMPVIVPLRSTPVAGTKQPARTVMLGSGEHEELDELDESNPYLRDAAAQTGQDVKALVEFGNNNVRGGR
jgi:hypothetical protein